MEFSGNKTKILTVILLLLLAFILNMQDNAFSKPNTSSKNINFIKLECLRENGNWVEKYNECEHISEITCKKLGGIYNECASPCRHMNLGGCISMCLPVCSFKKLIKP